MIRSLSLSAALVACLLCSSLSAQQTDLDSLDSDSNGKVSAAEFKTYVEGKLSGFEKLDEFAKLVDSNNDGEISEDEFESRMEKLQPLMNDEQESDDDAKKADPSEEKETDKGVRESFMKIKSHLKKHDWEAASKLMTKKAAERAVASQVVMAIAMLDMDLPPGIPGMEDALDEIDEVVEKHGLDDLDIDANSSMMMEMGEGDSEKLNESYDKILAALDKNGKRWAICSDVSKAMSSSPFSMNPLTGTVEDVVLIDGKVVVEINMAPEEMDGEGMQVQVMAPPVFYNFENEGGIWKNAGVDQKKTAAAMKDFAENMGGMGMGDGGDMNIEDLKPQETIEDPSFSGKTLDGKEFSLAGMKGKLVLVDFWGTWCPPCVAELPQLKKFHEEFMKHGFEVVGVASDDVDTLKEFSKDKTELTWTNVVDEGGKIADKFGIRAFPTSLLIDKDGNHIETDISKKELLSEIIERLELNKDDYADFLKRSKKKKKSDSTKD